MSNDRKKFNPAYIGKRDDILSQISVKTNKVLDVGCSSGALGEQIKQRFECEVTGIEVDENAARVAMEKLDKVIVGNLDNFNLESYFSNNYFDCIIFADVLEHTKNPWIILKHFSQFLTDDGIIIISLPNVRHCTTILNLIFKGYWPYRESGIHDKTHLRWFTLRNIKELIQYSNLKIVHIKRNYRITEKSHFSNRFAKYLGLPLLKEFFVYQYIVSAKKVKI